MTIHRLLVISALFLVLGSLPRAARADDPAPPPNEQTTSSALDVPPALAPTVPPSTPSPSAAVEDVPSQPRSIPMRTTGQVLTILGIVHSAAGAITTGLFVGVGGFLPALIIGVPIIGTGHILTAIGIPLWAVGASHERPRKAALVPELVVGPSGGGVSFSF